MRAFSHQPIHPTTNTSRTQWFATADNMLKPTPVLFDPEAFCEQGKVMDGWESRRRRKAGHDWSVVKLGMPGHVQGLEVDTAWFTGNQVPAVRVLAAEIDEDDDGWLGPRSPVLGVQGTAATDEEIEAAAARVASRRWVELLPVSPLRPGYVEDGGSVHRFAVARAAAARRATHLLVCSHPDGGIARLRAWGVVSRRFDDLAAAGRVDLLSVANGGRALGCSNAHYGTPRNLLRPGRGTNMGDGWETARNPRRPRVIVKDAASGLVHMPHARDWCVLRLGAVADAIDELTIDTHHFRGNYPESVLVEACDAPHATPAELLAGHDAPGGGDGGDGGGSGGGGGLWRELLPRTRLGPSAEHTFASDALRGGRVSHVRVTTMPDGGIMRVRAVGRAAAPMPAGDDGDELPAGDAIGAEAAPAWPPTVETP